MESQNFGHQHPVVLINESSELCKQSESAKCSRCGDAILSAPSFGCGDAILSAPSFGCADEECGFYIHKQCAEAPSQLNHPFHPIHPLCLQPKPPTTKEYGGEFMCSFCGETGAMFVYRCSCNIDLHIKCALFTYNIAEKKNGEYKLEHVACIDPSISSENDTLQVGSDPSISGENGTLQVGSAAAKCFGCWEPLFDSVHYSPDCGFNLHKKCAELSFQINFSCHRKHPLILQFTAPIFSCVICQDTDRVGFCYCCSSCNYVIHIGCLSLPSIIEDKKAHPHPFTLFSRHFSFTCDACAIKGNCIPYMCSQCNLLVHKTCISLPRIIKHAWHEHPIFHTYLLERHESKNWNCVICLNEVNTEHGNYNCSDCEFVVHVKCALRRKEWYYIMELENKDEKHGDSLALLLDMDSFTVIERNDVGEASKIKHFSHVHDLVLSDKIKEDDIFCDGCTLLIISDSVYHCSECKFFLHKICAEFPRRKHDWAHVCQQPRILISDSIFKCVYCNSVCNGFAYKCDECRKHMCLRCMVPYALTCQGHEHPLSFYLDHEGKCNACGDNIGSAYCCKACNFALDWGCLLLPPKASHKCDKHLLELTYHDDNSYLQSHFCDICEEDRNSSHWFYYCAICDISAHIDCVIGRYSFIKLGKIYKEGKHQHPLTFVKKTFYYPKCFICDKPCEDLAVECKEPECGYIIHWKCIVLYTLWEF